MPPPRYQAEEYSVAITPMRLSCKLCTELCASDSTRLPKLVKRHCLLQEVGLCCCFHGTDGRLGWARLARGLTFFHRRPGAQLLQRLDDFEGAAEALCSALGSLLTVATDEDLEGALAEELHSRYATLYAAASAEGEGARLRGGNGADLFNALLRDGGGTIGVTRRRSTANLLAEICLSNDVSRAPVGPLSA